MSGENSLHCSKRFLTICQLDHGLFTLFHCPCIQCHVYITVHGLFISEIVNDSCYVIHVYHYNQCMYDDVPYCLWL